jgi:NAD(P)-dependent dehydrogenase (short-subunit alcohol dehydrogenase family)
MSFDLGLSGRRALVTAGTKGVGASVIEVLRENGAKVVTTARSIPRSSLARALITIAAQNPPPRRFIAGSDAIAVAEQKIVDLKGQIEANRALSTSLAFD